MKKALLLALCLPLISAGQDYDLLIRGGHVMDPRNGVDRVMDVAVKDGRVAAVESSVKGSAKQIIDANGLYVTPGLIDIHVHVYAGTGERDSYAGEGRQPAHGHAVLPQFPST